MFGPQSTVVFVVLLAAFCGLTYVIMRQGAVALRLGAAATAFSVAALFGMATVNRFYDYYQTWTDAFDDLTGDQPGVTTLPPMAGTQIADNRDRAVRGLLVGTELAGAVSRIRRAGLVYLPPQYFQPRYARYRFPAIELLHGAPGQPSDWETGLHVAETYRKLLAERKAGPALVVIPDVNGDMGGETGSQCLNRPGGDQDDTYLSRDVPADVAARFRTSGHWGVAGFSEGGFCAANLALRHPARFQAAGVMSGYFQPLPENGGDPFEGDARQRLANDPLWLASQAPLGARLPAFWLMAGADDRGDAEDAQLFRSVLAAHGQHPPLLLVPHARHTFAAWNPALPRLLAWITAALPAAQPPPTQAAAGPAPGRPTGQARPAAQSSNASGGGQEQTRFRSP